MPRRLGVLGGGVVGCELAQAWRRLGSEVVLLVSGPRLLPSAEPVASEKVAAALAAAGGPVTVAELLPVAYDDVDEARHKIASFSLWAHLQKLVADGRATAADPTDLETTWQSV